MGPSEWIALGGVLIAMLSVVASLLKDDLRRWLWPPNVKADVSVTIFNVLVQRTGHYVPHAFVRLKLSLSADRGSAVGVQVSVLSCTPAPRLGGVIEVLDREMLRPLRWSFEHSAFMDLTAGSSRFVDLLEVSSNDNRQARLTTVGAPNEGLILNPAREPYKIRVLIAGHNIKPAENVIAVVHGGRWDGTAASLRSELVAHINSNVS